MTTAKDIYDSCIVSVESKIKEFVSIWTQNKYLNG